MVATALRMVAMRAEVAAHMVELKDSAEHRSHVMTDLLETLDLFEPGISLRLMKAMAPSAPSLVERSLEHKLDGRVARPQETPSGWLERA